MAFETLAHMAACLGSSPDGILIGNRIEDGAMVGGDYASVLLMRLWRLILQIEIPGRNKTNAKKIQKPLIILVFGCCGDGLVEVDVGLHGLFDGIALFHAIEAFTHGRKILVRTSTCSEASHFRFHGHAQLQQLQNILKLDQFLGLHLKGLVSGIVSDKYSRTLTRNRQSLGYQTCYCFAHHRNADLVEFRQDPLGRQSCSRSQVS